jgi:hypothetical protein
MTKVFLNLINKRQVFSLSQPNGFSRIIVICMIGRGEYVVMHIADSINYQYMHRV